MVIRYSVEELIAIRNLVTIQEYMKQVMEQKARQEEFQVFFRLQQQIEAQCRDQRSQSVDYTPSNQGQHQHQQQQQNQVQAQQQQQNGSLQLTDSVAEFFRKAEQNFYSQASIDPTKVRRLSEVEAELIGGN